ncbi:hypothetical protein TcasGA2_TC014835 [Tribolium castaneum]|uniref:Chitin-binding type-2 domain-containing protein n=1 Tax=Tribolium castaneum TaxID=7070 RepID=D2A4F1_TRICA|nr:PREDICTED: uncharacterized protein LOC103313341 [Tribolium castaneum]EFA04786.1 hypothetical protein TcasGA2_TC014835 [Tribolium castaneum]|eukprot:XP_008194581.1 PREDICTED: uncharacterized protein LOC103313341 [Tribolium castaneum]
MEVTTIILGLLVTVNYHIFAEKNEENLYCNETAFYPATFCNGYYECESYGFLVWTFGWTPVLKTCPNNHSFNFATKSCVASFCEAPLVCNGPGKYSVVPTKTDCNNDSCNNYYECEATWFLFVPLEWRLKLKTCPNEHIYEPSINDCVRSTNISTTFIPSITTTTTHSSNSTTISSSSFQNATDTSNSSTTPSFSPTTDGMQTLSDDESTVTSETAESTSTVFETNTNIVLLFISLNLFINLI